MHKLIVKKRAKIFTVSLSTIPVGRVDLIGLSSGKRPAEDSPTSEYGSGNFPSLTDASETASLDKKSVNMSAGTSPMDTGTKGKLSDGEKVLRAGAGRGRDRSTSPFVPPVGVSVEVVTSMEREMRRPEGAAAMKRTAGEEFIASKSPRLTGGAGVNVEGGECVSV